MNTANNNDMTAPSNPFRSKRSILPISTIPKSQNGRVILLLLGSIGLVSLFLSSLVLVRDSNSTHASSSSLNSNTRFMLQQQQQSSPIDPFDGIYDVAIIGSGPAGLTAAMFASRSGLSTIVFGSVNGLLSETFQLDNFPSFSHHKGGLDWLAATKQQAQDFGATFAPPGLMISSIVVQNNNDKLHHFVLDTSLTTQQHNNYQAHSIVLATGATPRRLNLPHESALWGKSLHNCAICDGSLYQDKTVLVVGGGNAAVDAALQMARYAFSIILVHRRDEFRANPTSLALLKTLQNVQIKTPYVVNQWQVSSKSNQLMGVGLTRVHDNVTETIKCDGAFLMIGSTPNTNWLHRDQDPVVELNNEGLVILQKEGQATSTPGIFAAGEIVDSVYRQAITAAAEGARAAMDAERWLRTTRGVRQVTARLAPVETPQSTTTRNNNNKVDCDLRQQSCIQQVVISHAVVVFSKPYCPYCKRALEALAAQGCQDPLVINLVSQKEVQDTLHAMTGRKTVPNVFIDGKSIGGGDETVKLYQEGKLGNLLTQAGAIMS